MKTESCSRSNDDFQKWPSWDKSVK